MKGFFWYVWGHEAVVVWIRKLAVITFDDMEPYNDESLESLFGKSLRNKFSELTAYNIELENEAMKDAFDFLGKYTHRFVQQDFDYLPF